MSDISKEERKKLREERRRKETKERREAKKIVKKNFTKAMLKLREEKGIKEGRKITRQIASAEMGIGFTTLKNYEDDDRNERLPDIIELMKIKEYYEVSYEYLLDGIDNPNQFIDEKAKKNQKAINDIKKILNDLNNEEIKRCKE